MINRIIEAFTKGYCEMNFIDMLIIMPVILILLVLLAWVMAKALNE